ncbi:MAG: HEAT repeat domain-containing protein [Pelistega sp.]|nr:HEAT repeat domain-containing protein [Pelistega sp.]
MENLFQKLSSEKKLHYIDSLGEYYNPQEAFFLLEVLNNNKEYDLVRIAAIESFSLKCLASESDEVQESCARNLLEVAEKDEDTDVRNYALQALSWFKSIEWLPQIIADIVLNQNEDPLVRESAFAILVSQKQNASSQQIFNKLLSDSVFGKSAERYIHD